MCSKKSLREGCLGMEQRRPRRLLVEIIVDNEILNYSSTAILYCSFDYNWGSSTSIYIHHFNAIVSGIEQTNPL